MTGVSVEERANPEIASSGVHSVAEAAMAARSETRNGVCSLQPCKTGPEPEKRKSRVQNVWERRAS
jgi:hypothetical protein